MRFFLLLCMIASTNIAQCDEWFRGNIHTHTSLSVTGGSSPDIVAQWYHDHNYNFLVLSNHNLFMDPNNTISKKYNEKKFILIPGQEISGHQTIHLTAINVDRIIPWDFNHPNKSIIIQNHVDEIIKAGGHAILNHPNYRNAVTFEDLLPVKRLYMFELFNGHPAINNYGGGKFQSTENMWDQLLTSGKIIYGVSSDDARHFQEIAPDKSNPGYGWVMVQASKLDPGEIVKAMVRGDFYASTGVFLKACDKSLDVYTIEIDDIKTQAVLSSHNRKGKQVIHGKAGYKIEFIGPNGIRLKEVEGLNGSYTINNSYSYVRAKVTYTFSRQNNGYEEYYAWGQPVFTDAKEIKSYNIKNIDSPKSR